MIGINKETSLAQSLVASVQLNLPGTVSKLSAKMRFIDKIAPVLRNAGLVKNIAPIPSISVKVTGIATAHRAIPAFGGILYISAAISQDVFIKNGSIHKTRQDSSVEMDEIDDFDYSKKIRLIEIQNAYAVLTRTLDNPDCSEFILIEAPIMLDRSDVPPTERIEVVEQFSKTVKIIEDFWIKYKSRIYPFNKNGIRLISVGSGKLGAILFALGTEHRDFIVDMINYEQLTEIVEPKMIGKIKSLGVKRLINGIMNEFCRSAAFQAEAINPDTRFEPESIRPLGLMSMHVKAGFKTPPVMLEMLGTVNDWTSGDLDDIASIYTSLFTLDQARALPLPLWYAKYALKPIISKPGILEYYKSQAREMLNNEEIDKIWQQDLELFED